MIQTSGELPYHEWFISFAQEPRDKKAFALSVDNHLRGRIFIMTISSRGYFTAFEDHFIEADAFIEYMKSQGKLGGQNKVARLGNDRKIADAIVAWKKD